MPVKVAFISRATLFTSPGGDTKQIELTARYLRLLDVEVDIFSTNDFIDYAKYNLLHFFNIIRPADIIYHIKRSKKPYVVSTIFVDYGNYEKKQQKGIRALVNRFFSEDRIEYLKVIARAVKNGERIISKDYLLLGHRRSVLYVAENAALLLPNSQSEYKRFEKKYNKVYKYRVVPNGIDAEIIKKPVEKNEIYIDSVLCVARIEGIKNQLNLIRALGSTKYQVYIHGHPSPNHIKYFDQCKKEATANIHICDWLNEKELYSVYHSAKVHVLPSYFETTGLSSLEAAAMGCNVVITDRGDTRDYFGDNAWYCDPDDPASIKAAVDAAFKAPHNSDFKDYILKHYTWEQAAIETLIAYRQVLKD
jgi:glycosyltransferase involved in cell wall biosynthesis